MKYYTLTVQPMGAVRMTRFTPRNKGAAGRYATYKEEIRLKRLPIPESGYHLVFLFKLSPSWSNKKKAEKLYTPHTQKPDRDNLEKAVLDSLFADDAHIWDGRTTKLWAKRPGLILTTAGTELSEIIQFLTQNNL